MAECKLRRGIERWMASDPSAMLEQSPAAIYSALDDARSDILTLCREVQRLSAALAAQPAASAGPSDEEIEALAHRVCTKYTHADDPSAHRYEFGMLTLRQFARALLSRYGRPAGDAQPVTHHGDGPNNDEFFNQIARSKADDAKPVTGG